MENTFCSGGSLSTNSSPCSLPPLPGTPSSMASSAIPKLPAHAEGSESVFPGLVFDGVFDLSPFEFDSSLFEASSQLIQLEKIGKCRPSLEGALTLPSISHNHFGAVSTRASPVTPTYPTCKPIVHPTTPEHLQRPSHSMSTIATTLLVLQRCMQKKLNGRRTEVELVVSQTRPQKVSAEIISTLQTSGKPDIKCVLTSIVCRRLCLFLTKYLVPGYVRASRATDYPRIPKQIRLALLKAKIQQITLRMKSFYLAKRAAAKSHGLWKLILEISSSHQDEFSAIYLAKLQHPYLSPCHLYLTHGLPY